MSSPPTGENVLTSKASISLRPDSLKAARSQMTQYWMRKTLPMAIALGILPVIGIGAVSYGVGQSLLGQSTTSQTAPEFQSNAQEKLLLLLIGSGVTGVLAGGLAWLWLKVFINALVKQSTQLVTQADQLELSESLQDFGYTIGLLQDQPSLQEVLDTAAHNVQSLLKVDRVLVFFNGDRTAPALQSEALGNDCSSLLESDLSDLSIPLTQLFDVPMGYVQVCTEVEGSDLPAPRQGALRQLNVQAQMVTQITLDNQSQGILVAQQCAAPRDWTEVEHQLFAAIAKQIGIAIDRKATSASSPSPNDGRFHEIWSDYRNHCFELSQTARSQSDRAKTLVSQSQHQLDQSHLTSQGFQQTREQMQTQPELIQESETTLSRSISSMTETQVTLMQTAQSSEQLLTLSQNMAELTNQIKGLSDQVNYEAMNASITSKKQASDQSWSLEFTNQILKMTREMGRHTSELEKLSTQTSSESQAIATALDTGNEQILISVEWLKNSLQQMQQLSSTHYQLQATLDRLMESTQEEHRRLVATHPELMEMTQWLAQTVDQTEAILQSLDQESQRALA